MKKIYLLSVLSIVIGFFTSVNAQVSLSATSGTLTGTYTTLKAAFDSINVGKHKGDIIIQITANTVEGPTPATLLSGDADPTNYSSITIYPTVDGVSISGNPASGFGVVQLDGADNVLIDGDNPNTAGTNRNLSIVNTAATATTFTSCLRVATLAGASAKADNIFLFNTNFTGNVTNGNNGGITSAASSSNNAFGLYFGGKGSATSTLTAITSEIADSAKTGTTMDNIVINNIAVNQCGRGIVFNGAAATVSSSLSITNSVIGATATISGYPVAAPASTVYAKGIWIAGTNAVYIYNNTIQNIISYTATTVAGIELASNMGSGIVTIDKNIIKGVVNNGTAGTANGIVVSSAAAPFTISANTVSFTAGSFGATTSPVAGINVATTGGTAQVIKNNVSGVFNQNLGGYGALGIYFSAAANGSEISNNFVSDIMNNGNASFTNTTENASGILIAGGSSHRIYHNSVNLFGVSPATASNVVTCFSVASAANASLDIRNNIFSNTVTGGSATDAHVCMYFPFAAAAANGYVINNNAYYTGAIANKSGIAFAGASTYAIANLYSTFDPYSTTGPTNFRNWSTATGIDNNDFASFSSTAAAPFVSATDLHIVAGSNRLESGGVAIPLFTSDIDNNSRNTFPDIGADEFTGTIQDLTAPLITYTPLSGTCTLGNQTLIANIKDTSGVPTSGGGLPVLYFKINAGAYTPVTAVSLGSGNYSFSFGAAAVISDVVSYYIVAQDGAATPNAISSPSIGAGPVFGTNPPTSPTVPTNPENFLVQNPLAPGLYPVGSTHAAPFNTLTNAVNTYNTSCLSGGVIFELDDATYSGAETFPIVIGNPSVTSATSTLTLTIRPAAGVNVLITGSSADAIIKFNGADYVTIDGLNAGSSLTISNSNVAVNSAVIWMANAAGNGATHNSIRNSTVIGNGTNTTYAGIVSCSGNTIGTLAGTANSFNSYQNVTIYTAYRGIALIGASSGDNNDTITNCKIGSTTAAQKIGFRGIYIFNQTNVNITDNLVFGISNTNSASINDVVAGISVRGAISNGVIGNNIISDIKNITAGAWTAHGITLQSTSSNTGLSVYNNFIYDIAGLGYNFRVQDNGYGIGILTGGGYKVYYNSMSINTNQINGSGISAAIFIDNRPTTFELGVGSTPVGLNIRDNIFSNQQTTGTRYSIYSLVPASSFTVIDYNDYYTTGTNLGFLGSARLNLAAWQSATGGDVNSVSVIPLYTSATNLHLSGASTLNNLGTNIAGFPTDIDGDTRNAIAPDMGADEFTPPNCGGTITAGVITASQTTVCVSDSITLTATGFSFGTGMVYQWQSSPDNATWATITGKRNPSAAVVPISTTTYYRLTDTCTLTSSPANSASVLVTVNSPAIVSTTGNSICGLGTVSLSAVGSSGTSLRWYDVRTGGLPLSTGSPYITPAISTTTRYYVEAVAGITTGSVGPVSPTAEGGTIGTQTVSWDVGFDVIQTTTLVSIDVYPITTSGSGTLNVYNSSNTVLASIPYTYTVSGGATPQTIPINILLAPGSYYIEDPALFLPGTASRNTSNAVYPYTSSAIRITGNGFDPTYFMCYYNWQFTSGCASKRDSALATITPPPPFTHPTTTPGAAICQGIGSININATDADYINYSWSPVAGLANATTATPTATPATTTLYTVIVNNGTGPGSCATSDTLTITVNPTPNAVTITPVGPIAFCVGAPAQSLTASGGSGDIFRERFETLPITKFAVTDSRITATQSTTYFQEGIASVRLFPNTNSISDASPSAYAMTNNINLSQYSSSVLTFYHIAAFEATYDFGYVEYTTDNGANWIPFPASSYTGTAALKNGVVAFDKSSYSDWGTQFTSETSTPGAGPATSLWKLETINLAPWQTSTQFKIRFRIKTDVSLLYYGWLIDDIKINTQGTLTWSPITDLYTDPGATIPYSGTNLPVVYTKPTANRTYTAKAAFGACPATAAVQVNLTNNAVTLAITSAQGTAAVCGADTVDLSAVPTPAGIYGGTVFYEWKKNGTTITGGATGGSSVGTTVTVASTATLFPGMKVSVTAGGGFFYPNTVITNILSATQFTVSFAPSPVLSAATIAATASGSSGSSTAGSSVGTTVTVASTTSFSVGMKVTVTAGTGAFAANTIITGIINATQFTVSAAPSTVLAGATVYGTMTGAIITPLRYSNLATGDQITCVISVFDVPCMPINPVTSNTLTFTILPTTATSVTISTASTTVCETVPVTFNVSATANPGPTPTYEWFIGPISQGVPSASTSFTTSALTTGQTVTCRMYSSATNCPFPKAPYSNPLTMTVNPSFPVSVTIASSPAAVADTIKICNSTSVTFTATPTNGGATPAYQWQVNGVNAGANSPTFTTSTLANLDSVRCIITSSLASCALNNPDTSNVIYVSVTTQVASVSIAPTTAICAGTPRTYTATAVNGGTPAYQWYVNSLPVGTNAPTYNYTPINNDLVEVRMTSSLSCATPNPAIFSFNQAVNALPSAGITGNSTTYCPGIPVALNSNALAGSGTISAIQWRLNYANIGGGTALTYTATTFGLYKVTITNSNGCTDTSGLYNITDGSGPLNGTYYIGRITAANVSGSTTTLSATSTANLVVGSLLTKVSGGGTLAANTIVTSIINGTTFTVNNAPSVALSAANIGGADCDDYLSFATAIADLNTRNMGGVGGCTFNVQPGYIENLTAKLPALGAGGSLNPTAAGRTLVFQKNGAGANPKIVAYTGGTATPASAIPDGLFTIAGTDNVTIDGIDLEENAANTTNPSTMEYGYGLFKLAAGDGVQNATIKNCVVTLNKVNNALGAGPMVEGSVGILVINSAPTTATTAFTGASAPTNGGTVNTNGTNSNNKFYTNTIQNCNYGIVLSGYVAAAGGPTPVATSFLGDLGNDIGGLITTNGNTILNFGSAGTNPAAGIRATNQWSVNVQYNTINSNNGSGTNHAGQLRGIFGESGTSANATISNNTVTVKTASTALAWTGIDNIIGSTALGNTININNNVVQNCGFSAATSPAFLGISTTSTAATLNINNNKVTGTAISNTGTSTLINVAGASNTTVNIGTDTVSNITNAAASGTIRGISVGSGVTGTVNANIVEGVSYTAAAGTGTIDAIVSAGNGQAYTYSNNIIRNLSIPATGTINGIRENGNGASTKIMQNNQIYNFSTTAGGAGGATFNGIFGNAGVNYTISGNEIYALNSTGTTGGTTGVIAGIQTTGSTGVGNETYTISKNKIYSLSTNSTGPVVHGLLLSGPGSAQVQTLTASNNFIADLKAPFANAADVIRGITVNATAATTTFNIYYNSIYLNAASTGANFSTAGVYHNAAAAGIGNLNLINNIVFNTSTPGTSGRTVAFRRSGTALTNYSTFAGAASNNNLFYAGTPSSTKFIYYDGTNSDQILSAYKTRVSTRDAASVSDSVTFTSATDLHLVLDANCAVDGKGAVVSVTDDIDNQARNGSTPDIGADEITGSNPVSLTVTNPATTCGSVDLTLPAVTTGSSGGYWYSYFTDVALTTALAPPNNVTVGGTYYIKYNKGGCFKSNAVVVSFNPAGSWLGIDNNWNNTANWCSGTVPTIATDVIIPGSVPNYPIITSASTPTTAFAKSVTINAGASITTTGVGSLEIKTTFTNSGTLNNWGEILLTGSTAQTFPGATGAVNAMTRLSINNTAGVTINRNLLIREAITPTAGTVTLSNVYVTLRSVVDSTARIGVVGGSFAYTGTGNFVVERYFPAKRAWRLITAPVVKTASKTVFNSWQGGGNNSITGNATYVSGPGANPATNGFDVSPANNHSLKVFDYVNNFNGPAATKGLGLPAFPAGSSASPITDTTGYFMFVRGDRTPANLQPFNPYIIGNSTVLRDTGNVKFGNFVHNCNPNPAVNVNFSLIGNPYASAVNFKLLTRNTTISNKFRVWDPTLSSVGGWVVRDYSVNPAGINNVASTNVTDTIRSSQAFVVETSGSAPSPTVTFTEAAKLTSPVSSLLFRPVPLPSASLLTSLYFIKSDGTDQLADGVLAQFSDDYIQGNDYMDAVKFTNINETFCIRNANNYLAMDRRPFLHYSDTLFFNMARMRQFRYKFNVSIDNIIQGRNRVAYLNDKFRHTATALNMHGDTWVNFDVTPDAASSGADRFFITFKKVAKFNGIHADVLYSDAVVNWSVENAELVNRYEVERSSDGKAFEKAGEVAAKENGAVPFDYTLTDPALAAGDYYYRVKAVSSSYGADEYSDVVKVKVMKEKEGLYVYPNPVTDGVIGLKMQSASPEGKYAVRLINNAGQAVAVQQFQHIKASQSHSIAYPSYVSSGAYELEVTAPDKKKFIINIMIAKQ